MVWSQTEAKTKTENTFFCGSETLRNDHKKWEKKAADKPNDWRWLMKPISPVTDELNTLGAVTAMMDKLIKDKGPGIITDHSVAAPSMLTPGLIEIRRWSSIFPSRIKVISSFLTFSLSV